MTLQIFLTQLPVKVFKTPNDRQSYILSEFRLTFPNRHMIVWFSWIFSICEIYGEYKTAGHLIRVLKTLTVTCHKTWFRRLLSPA